MESLVGDAGEAVVGVGVMGESGAMGGGVAHRGRLLDNTQADVDAAAGGVFDGLLGLVGEVVALQAAAGRPHGGGVGHTGAGARATHPSDRRTRGLDPCGARWRAAWIACGWVGTCVCERGSVLEGPRKEVLGKGTMEGTCSLSDAGGNRARKGNAREGTKEGTCSPFDVGGNVCMGGKSVRKCVSGR